MVSWDCCAWLAMACNDTDAFGFETVINNGTQEKDTCQIGGTVLASVALSAKVSIFAVRPKLACVCFTYRLLTIAS